MAFSHPDFGQVAAVVPISILLISVMGIFFGVTVESPVLVVFGLTMAILGLTVFIDALRVVVMPLSEQLGTELPKTLELPGVLCVTCFLGVLVTYAEPAITSLRPLARLVDPDVAPYLYCILMQKQELLVFCIGLGVGLAAMLGTLRFVRGWSLKPMISCSMVPCLMCACYMWWGDPELRPLLGLAWDCGAVTTGPVTVPVLLALGIGVMKTQKEKRLAAEAAVAKMRGRERVAEAAANALEGFGIVTLASLMPVLAVELLAISLKFSYTHADIIAMKSLPVNEDSLLEHSPYREIYFAIRAILPVCVCMDASYAWKFHMYRYFIRTRKYVYSHTHGHFYMSPLFLEWWQTVMLHFSELFLVSINHQVSFGKDNISVGLT